MRPEALARSIRHDRSRIAARWHDELDHRSMLRVGELLGGIAAWLDGDRELAERAFATAGRIGRSPDVETTVHEYAMLRRVLVRELDGGRDQLLQLHEAIDHAIAAAMRHFAAERERVRERFIAILGHDLRDPLATIAIVARRLDRRPELRDPAGYLLGAVQRLTELVDDLLEFARGHLGGGLPAFPAACDLGALCRRAADEVAMAHPERELAVELDGDLHGELDGARVSQAIGNLLWNAVRHGEGRIELAAYEVGDDLVTAVTSHGDARPSGEAGLGLGLYIVDQIAQAHGATCTVHRRGDATTFEIRWPRQPNRAACQAGSSASDAHTTSA
ncbi:MAG TPA: HAMP domain-containing sensor histidine kinase [Kofleriaceae bacterium]|nr:HAMP domain-containing sensor histidine kinase [Kofleriaceae bacterium]